MNTRWRTKRHSSNENSVKYNVSCPVLGTNYGLTLTELIHPYHEGSQAYHRSLSSYQTIQIGHAFERKLVVISQLTKTFLKPAKTFVMI